MMTTTTTNILRTIIQSLLKTTQMDLLMKITPMMMITLQMMITPLEIINISLRFEIEILVCGFLFG